MKISDSIGRAIGAVFAPLAAGASLGRRARVFHPRGVVYRARVVACATADPGAEVGRRMAGPALVRLSGAIWKHLEWFDVLGVAIRLRSSEAIEAAPAPGDQDLLLASFRRSWTLPVAPLRTRASDFLANDYYAALPLSAGTLGRIDLRLRPLASQAAADPDASRAERLARDVGAGRARFAVEVRPRNAAPGAWTAIAELTLIAAVAIDQEALRFSPFRTGRGIAPVGFLQALRRATYPASQAGRRLATRGRGERLAAASSQLEPVDRARYAHQPEAPPP